MFRRMRLLPYICFILTGVFALLQLARSNDVSAGQLSIETDNTYYFYQRPKYPRDCREVVDQCHGRNLSGVYLIKPDGYPYPFEVYCNNRYGSAGWTVFLRRLDGTLDFSRNWEEYKEGFGFLSSEFWLGSEKLAFLTNQQRYELRIDVVVSNGSKAFMTYSSFRVKDEWGNYSLATLGNAAGNTDFIVPTCPRNMIHANCTCERTCEAPNSCQNNCRDAFTCICPEGFFLKGNDCVPPEDCDCYLATANKVIPVNEYYVNGQCSQRCSCSKNGLACNNYVCNANAICTSTSNGGQCNCKRGFVGDGQDCGCQTDGYLVDGSMCRRPKDCGEVPHVKGYNGSGLYHILPSNWQEFQVYCNMSDGNWTVLQRRIPGSGRNFKLSWNSYKNGFGELFEDFWLGNDKIHHLTSQRDYQLRIDLIDSANRHYVAQYEGFRIDNERSKYRMIVLGTYSGNAGYDAMRDHFNQPFSTHDQDNDDSEGYNCYEEESDEERYCYCTGTYDGCTYYGFHYDGGHCYVGAYSDADCCQYCRSCNWRSRQTTECNFQRKEGRDCANLHEGAWWYKKRNRISSSAACDWITHTNNCCNSGCSNCGSYSYSCAFSNLNGKKNGAKGETIFWHGLSGNVCGIKYTEMRVRPI